MKRSLEALRIGLVAGALMVPAGVAQTRGANPNRSSSPRATNPAPSGQTVPGTDMNSPSRTDRTDRDHDFNFGWLGLVGLAGLLGLRHRGSYDEPRNVDNTGPGRIR